MVPDIARLEQGERPRRSAFLALDDQHEFCGVVYEVEIGAVEKFDGEWLRLLLVAATACDSGDHVSVGILTWGAG